MPTRVLSMMILLHACLSSSPGWRTRANPSEEVTTETIASWLCSSTSKDSSTGDAPPWCPPYEVVTLHPPGAGVNKTNLFGEKLATIPDVDGNGYDDLLVGSHSEWGPIGCGGPGDLDATALCELICYAPIHLHLLNADGSMKARHRLGCASDYYEGNKDDLVRDWLVRSGSMGGGKDLSAWSMAGVGDVDGNGVSDVIVTTLSGPTPVNSTNRFRGQAWLYLLGADDEGVYRFTGEPIDVSPTDRLNRGDMFGTSITGVGDIDGDGIPDVAIGAVGDDDEYEDDGQAYSSRGAVYILLMGRGPDNVVAGLDCHVGRVCVKGSSKISDATAPALQLVPGDKFGSSIAWLGNNRLAVGVPKLGDAYNGSPKGLIHVIELSIHGEYVSHTNLTAAEIIHRGDNFPTYHNVALFLAGGGDVDRDGIPDLVIGSPWQDARACMAAGATFDCGKDRGAAHVVLLQEDGSLKRSFEISSDGLYPQPSYRWKTSDSYFGKSVSLIRRYDRICCNYGMMLAVTEPMTARNEFGIGASGAKVHMINLDKVLTMQDADSDPRSSNEGL